MKKGIIFDMDGTLWDSAANVAESWNLAIKQDGSVDKKLTEQDIQGVMGKTMDDRRYSFSGNGKRGAHEIVRSVLFHGK